ncbi:MAG: hypothetical protein ACI8P3_004406, partial [Saprospiraceae bacterium]
EVGLGKMSNCLWLKHLNLHYFIKKRTRQTPGSKSYYI